MNPAKYLRLEIDQSKQPSLQQAAQSLVERAWLNGYAAATNSALSRLAFLASVDAKSITKGQLLTELRTTIAHLEVEFSNRVE